MKTLKTNARRESGFTLIEVMVVVVIIGLLAALVVPNLVGKLDDARLTKAKTDIASIENLLEQYRIDNFAYPTTDQGLEALVNKPTDPEPVKYPEGGYTKRLPLDPWERPYQYLQPGAHGSFDLYSLGPDRQPDTDDDIGNWNLDSVK